MNTLTAAELIAALDTARTETPGSSVESAIMIYQAAQAQIDAYAAIKDQAKTLITDIMTATGITAYTTTTAAGKVAVTAPSISITYDAKALDIICQANQQVAALLAPYRKETLRAGTVRITGAK